jgi:hypothetical protein
MLPRADCCTRAASGPACPAVLRLQPYGAFGSLKINRIVLGLKQNGNTLHVQTPNFSFQFRTVYLTTAGSQLTAV